MDNVGKYVTKALFASLFKTAWVWSTTFDVAVKGFKETGLSLLNERTDTESVKVDLSKAFAQT